MLRKRFFFFRVKLSRAVDFYVSRADGRLYMSGFGGVKSIELFDCFYRDKEQVEDLMLSLKFFNRRLFRGVFIAVGGVCRDFYWGFFFEIYVYGPGFVISWWCGDPPLMIEFSIGLTHAIYFLCQCLRRDGHRVLVRGDRESVVFYAVEKKVLYDIVACVVLLKRMNPYKIMGVVYPHQLIRVKKAIKKMPV